LGNVTSQVNNGDTIIVDGLEGVVIVNPDENTINEYKAKKENYDKKVEKLKKLKDLPAITPDGKKVMLAARPVTIRTLDIGGDKELPYLDMPKEMNPFLGYRAIRLCLDKTDIFKTQLRAILRASAYGNIHIMYPMISSIEDVRKANIVLNEVKAELDKEGIKYDKNIKVGIMVEIPSAAVTADILAKEVDFFSIGTNDLTQYTLAVDRMNEHVKDYYQPFNPAVLRLIKFVIDAAHKEGRFAAMCSMSATSIPTVKNIIRNVEYERAKEIAEKVLNIAEAEKIQKMMEDIIKDIE
jgi:phosphotransferase system enzyme I (PtsI)